MNPEIDPETRVAVEDYVDRTLAEMPEHLRLGVAAESMVFGARSRVEDALGRLDRARLLRRLDRWKASSLDPIRQYVRLLESLVLFAENELA
jgi:hypothetical protein